MKTSKEKKNRRLGVIAVVAVFSILGMLFAVQDKGLPRDRDTEFDKGSGIQISALSDVQTDSLYKLCKVWGYTKYYHPSVIAGDVNWDAELFRIMPKVLKAKDSSETNEVLSNWLKQFPFEIENDETAKKWEQLQEEYGKQVLDISWMEDTAYLGTELSSYLCELSQNITADREHAYASFGLEGTVTFENEKMYPVADEDAGMKLLGLFRFWNMYEYYSPNVEITIKDWDDVLRESIPKAALAQDYRSYVLAIAHTTSMTGDAHITVKDKERIILDYYGTCFLQCSIKMVDGQPVVQQAAGTEKQLQPGDILLEIDGIPVEDRMKELSEYLVLSEPDKVLCKMQRALLQTEEKSAEVRVLRKDSEVTLQVTAGEGEYTYQNPLKNGILEGEKIGYIDPSTLKTGELEERMKEFQDTKGMIVDFRYYPSVFIPYLLGEYIIPTKQTFAVMGMPNQAVPGAYWQLKMQAGKGIMKEMSNDNRMFDEYSGKVILLMDETTISSPEFTIMALRQSPNAVVVGSPSIGADGNVVKLSLPGQILMNMTGLGVYTPEGGQTQRCGLEPDIEVYPTVEGLRDERDELLEKAVEIVNK